MLEMICVGVSIMIYTDASNIQNMIQILQAAQSKEETPLLDADRYMRHAKPAKPPGEPKNLNALEKDLY